MEEHPQIPLIIRRQPDRGKPILLQQPKQQTGIAAIVLLLATVGLPDFRGMAHAIRDSETSRSWRNHPVAPVTSIPTTTEWPERPTKRCDRVAIELQRLSGELSSVAVQQVFVYKARIPIASIDHAADYAEVRDLIIQAGLLRKQPVYYLGKMLQVLTGLGLVGALLAIDSGLLNVVAAGLLACVFTHVAFLGHDAAHGQVFQSRVKTNIFCLWCSLMIGISFSWWTDKHSRHHRNPNHLGLDPDVRMRFPVMSEMGFETPGWRRWLIRHQGYLFFPALLLEGFAMRIASVRHVLGGDARFPVVEGLLLGSHIVLYLGLVVVGLGTGRGVMFVMAHQALFGLYMGSVFATNHKGMPTYNASDITGYLQRQVMTARNVRPHPLTDFWFGGLNYQIEHHLFPRIPRNKLKPARRIVKRFCESRNIPYHETRGLTAYREVWRHLHRVGGTH